MNNAIADQIKEMLVENLRIPENILTYDSELFGDEIGLDSIDRLMLTCMIKNYNGGPVGLETIAAAIGEEAVTIEDVYEPYLMQIGFLSRTPRGRCVTPAGYRHLGFEMPGQQQLF